MKSIDRYTRIIEQLLMLSRLEPEQSITYSSVVNVNKIIETQLADIGIKAIDKNIELSFIPSNTPAIMIGNDVLLGVLFRNLVDNAIRYMNHDQGKITLSTHVLFDKIVCQVKDNGPGVLDENLHRIFDRFYRQEGSEQPGSGLGLSIVAEIVRLHEGTVCAKMPEHETGLHVEITFLKVVEK